MHVSCLGTWRSGEFSKALKFQEMKGATTDAWYKHEVVGVAMGQTHSTNITSLDILHVGCMCIALWGLCAVCIACAMCTLHVLCALHMLRALQQLVPCSVIYGSEGA